jgi:hypothetical protein
VYIQFKSIKSLLPICVACTFNRIHFVFVLSVYLFSHVQVSSNNEICYQTSHMITTELSLI